MALYKLLCEIYTNTVSNDPSIFGYSHPYKATIKWNNLLKAGSLENFLLEEHYDLVHTNSSFLLKVWDVYGLDQGEIALIIHKSKAFQHQLAQVKTPYIFVQTDFIRQNEPIFALACMDHLRRIRMDKVSVLRSNDEGLSDARLLCKSHYEKHLGVLPLWGSILNYQYVVNQKRYIFDKEGHVLDCVENQPHYESTVKLHLH